jgi:predicted dehydrogenase
MDIDKSNPRKVLLVGLGKIGLGRSQTLKTKNILSHYSAISKTEGLQFEALVDHNPLKRFELDKTDMPKFHTDLTKASENKEFDIAIIAVPTCQLLNCVELLLQFNKPKLLLIEKPLGLDERLWINANLKLQKYGVRTHVNYSRRVDPGFCELYSRLMFEDRTEKFKVVAKYSGSFFNSASHLLDIFTWFFGELKEFGAVRLQKYNAPSGEEGIDCYLEYDSASVSITYIGHSSYPVFELDVFAENGVYRVRSPFGGITYEKAEVGIEPQELRDSDILFQNTTRQSQKNVAEELLQYFESGQIRLTPLSSALTTLGQLRTIFDSATR